MPILFAKSFKASDGKCYGTLEEAQLVELIQIMNRTDPDKCQTFPGV